MKIQFTQLILALGITATLTSCSKDKNDEIPAGVSCTIDGTNMQFNVNAFALKNDGGGNYSYGIYGTTDASANASAFALVVGGDQPITAGTTYTFDEDQPDDQIKMGTLNYAPGGTTDGFISVPGPSATPTQITITAVSDKSIQGTFKGDIIGISGSNPQVKTVTNGKFNVPIMQ